MNDGNLLKGNATRFKSGEEAAKNGQKGGVASGIARRKKSSMASIARQIAATPIASDKVKRQLQAIGVADDELTNAAVVVASVYSAATKGDIKAIEKWEQLAEAKDDDEKVYELPARVLGKAYVDINRNITPNRTYVFKGGRGSLKSSYVSLKIIELLKNNPTMHACVVRKVGSTIKDSVYSQIKWAINELGLEDEFEYKKSPPEIVLKKTGQVIYFRGCDDPVKLKSTKPVFGYIGILWIEELDQINGEAEERSVRQSILRGGSEAYAFMSYNPPKTSSAWVNKALLIPDENRVVHSTTYLDAPDEWLGQVFIDDAEHLKDVNPQAYAHEYLGEVNGTGGQVFEDVEVRAITDDEIKRFDRIYQGVDWGWFPDPYAFIRCAYDTARETIYIFDEHVVNKQSNAQTARWLIEHGYNDYRITCDSAENKSVNDYKDAGLPAIPAIKGAGSVEYSFKWLQVRHIVVDPIRCPHATQEITEYEYERDKEGNVISGYPDKNNHSIDALRYAFEQYWTRRGNSA